MVRKVEPHHKRQLQEDIDREKKNIFLCMHPAATVVSFTLAVFSVFGGFVYFWTFPGKIQSFQFLVD